MSQQFAVTIVVVVKAESRQKARDEVRRRLVAWFAEDLEYRDNMPEGSLLHYRLDAPGESER